MDSGPGDEMLLRAVADRDMGAFRTLYERHAGWLAVRLARRCNDRDLVADAIGDTFVAVWQKPGGFAALGGPLLGVALGRWVRFPGAAFVLFLVLYGWVSLVMALTLAHPDSAPVAVLRLFSPFAYFTYAGNAVGVTAWRGSPWFFIGWQLALCAIAVLVALLRGAEGRVRSRIIRSLAIAGAAAVILLVLAATGGFTHAVTA